MKQINTFLLKVTFLLLGIFICQNSYAIDYPTTVCPESDYQIKFSDETTAYLTSHWVQKTDYLTGNAADYPFFAVSGDYFFIYDKPNNKILKFDRMKGTHIEDITIYFNGFEEHEIGFMAADDAQNLYISTVCTVEGNPIQPTVTRKATHYHFPGSTISVFDQSGKVTNQFKSDDACISFVDNSNTITKIFYNNIKINGNILENNNFLVSIPSLYHYTVNGVTSQQSRVSYYQSYDNNVLKDITTSTNILTYKFYDPLVVNSSTDELFEEYSFSPIEWLPGKGIYDYKVDFSGTPSDENFYGISVLGLTSDATYSSIVRHSESLSCTYDNLSDNGFNQKARPGAVGFKYGDFDMIADAVYLSENTDNWVQFNVREISYNAPFKQIQVNYVTDLATVPSSVKFTLREGSEDYAVTRIQAVESIDDESNPQTDIYLYAPGRGIAYYTIAGKKVSTGLISTISDDENAIEYNNGLVKAAAGTSIQVYNLSGMFIQTLNVPQTGSVSIENLPSGFYVLSAGNNHLKICK